MKYSSSYDLQFSLLNNFAADGIVDWDIEDALKGEL